MEWRFSMDEPVQVAGGDVRSRASSLIRERQDALAGDIGAAIAAENDALDGASWRAYAELLLRLFAASVDAGSLDTQSSAMRELERYCPPLTTRQLLNTLHHAERAILDDVALDERLGATSEPWAIVAHVIRRATLEILGAHAEQVAGRDVPVAVRDSLTTLIAAPVFDLAVAQEIERAIRHAHALALLLFDIDDLSQINREHGYGVGDRLLERLGILARQYFRTHDWVARHGDDAIAVLLPETPVDQAAILAARFREMVQQRLVLQDHKTNVTKIVTVSAAVVGTDRVQSDLDARNVLAEAEAAVLRAKLNGRNRIERVALLPTSLTIFGASTLLGLSPHEVTHLIRDGSLKATRRGRHYHIDRDLIEAYRKTSR
jgi:diguanylate cyclase (GGDEF)-like protein/excisionase family DNA binding protein